MQLGKHISLKHRGHAAIYSLTLGCFVLSSLLQPTQAYAAASPSQLMNDPAFVALVGVVFNLNSAMEDAANNPQDNFRRQNVQQAFRMLPPAIVGLAKQFKQNKFGNSTLPIVQKMLGGFVNVNAADGFKRFMQKPSKNLIPKVGSTFPYAIAKKAAPGLGGNSDQRQLTMDSSAKNPQPNQNSSTPAPSNLQSQLANLNDEANFASSQAGPADGKSLVFDDQTSKPPGDGDNTSSATPNNSSFSNWSNNSSQNTFQTSSNPTSPSNSNAVVDRVVADAAKDIQALEANQSGLDSDVAPAKRDPSSDNYSSAVRPPALKRPSAGDYATKVGPQFWSVVPAARLTALLFSLNAHAEDAEAGGGGESGAEASAMLMNLALMMAAVAPAVAAISQANADKQIAQLNANAQIQETQISAQTSLALAQDQKDVALAQAQISEKVSEENQAATTQRLEDQLVSLDSARNQANQMEYQRQQFQESIDQQRLNLAEQQAQKTEQIADRQYRDQITQADLTGVSAVQNSGGNLVSSRTLNSGYQPGAAIPNLTGQNPYYSSNGTVAGVNSAALASNSTAGKAPGLGFAANQGATSGARGLASSKLLASVNGSPTDVAAATATASAAKVKASATNPALGEGFMGSSSSSKPWNISVSPALKAAISPVINGSTPTSKLVMKTSNSDLRMVLNSAPDTTGSTSSFAKYSGNEGTPHISSSRNLSSTGAANSEADATTAHAYKAPAIQSSHQLAAQPARGQF